MSFTFSRSLANRSLLWLAISSQMIILVRFSQTGIIVGDEGFYLLAAQLVNGGKRPYIDFFYQHTPLYLYVFALWMRLFGESWRSAHFFAAILTGISLLLVGNIVYSRLRSLGGHQTIAVIAVWFMGSSVITLLFGTMALPYSLAIFLIVLALWLTFKSVDHSGGGYAIIAGLCASSAAMSTLLAMPASIVLLLWLVRHSHSNIRFRRWLQFSIGAIIPFILLLWLFIEGPKQVIFDLIEYQIFYRRVGAGWTDIQSVRWDVKLLASWFQSTQGMLFGLLSLLGALFLKEFGDQEQYIKREFSLCGWLGLSLGIFASLALPTFQQYFILTIPFLSVLASVGVYSISLRVLPEFPKILIVFGLIVVFTFDSVFMVYHYGVFDDSVSTDWQQVEVVANTVNEVTNKGYPIYSSEAIYFAGQIVPPSGLENSFTALLPSSVANIPKLHLISQNQIDELLKSGYYEAVVVDAEDKRVISLDLEHLYRNHEQIYGKIVFWDRVEF